MPTYKTPGVYVEEIATLPPSVADVATAIPAFLGYTESGPKGQPTRLTSMVDYAHYFGGPKPTAFTVTMADSGDLAITKTAPDGSPAKPPAYLMYYSLKMYFDNGGGPCYVVSVGNYAAAPQQADFTAGLAALEKEDEPTLILLTDAVNLGSDYYGLCQTALDQCGKLGDRFAILDILDGDNRAAAFRQGIGINNLKYGAAYFPFLQTTLPYAYVESQVTVKWPPTFQIENGIRVTSTTTGVSPKVQIVAGSGTGLDFDVTDGALSIKNVGNTGTAGAQVVAAWQAWKAKPGNKPQGFDVTQVGDGSAMVTPAASQNLTVPSNTLDELKDSQTQLYNQVKAALGRQRVVMPPSPAMAGIYAAVDRDRGVWKAPANVSVASVLGPTVKVTNDDQDHLNVDPTAGKSINAIRSFAGKGTIVWGARTLAGNDNEWRYINVRRLFNMIEESTRKASAFAVFEANDATTWLKVKGMIDSYLYGLWEQGALAGPTPDKAYYVNVGLGKTMTAQDILEGRMIVEIGIAAVRPAEFIVIRFSHKMQGA
jgi:phage tail sheath protein FI